MELFNIGPLELILFLMLMFIILGPQDMVNWSRRAGAWIRKLIRSQIWAEIRDYSQEIRELPTKIVRESGLEEDLKEIRETTNLASDLAKVDATEVAGENLLGPQDAVGANFEAGATPILTYPTTIPEPVIPAASPQPRFSPDTFDIDAAPTVPFYLRDFVKREEERIRQEKEAAEKAARETAEREAAEKAAALLAEQQAAEAAKKPRRKRTPKAEAVETPPEGENVEKKPRKRTPRQKTVEPESIPAEVSPDSSLAQPIPPPVESGEPALKPRRTARRKKDIPAQPVGETELAEPLTTSPSESANLPEQGQETPKTESEPANDPQPTAPRKRSPRKKKIELVDLTHPLENPTTMETQVEIPSEQAQDSA